MADAKIIGFYLPTDENGCFSSRYPAQFRYGGVLFENVVQYMVYHKVMLSGRYDIARQVMSMDDPEKIMELGRMKPARNSQRSGINGTGSAVSLQDARSTPSSCSTRIFGRNCLRRRMRFSASARTATRPGESGSVFMTCGGRNRRTGPGIITSAIR